MRLKLGNTKAMTLVELAIALGVTVMVIVGVLGLYYENMLVIKKSNQLFIATNMAKSRLELLRSLGFTALPFTTETDTYLNEQENSDANGQFVRNTSVATNYSGDSNLTQVTVSVDYKVKGQLTGKPISLTTVYVNQ